MKLDLHIHSKYSFDSRSDVAGIIRAAKARGLDGAAITDHETMAGVGEALGVAKKEGFTLIPAEEILTEKGEIIGYMLSEEIHAKDPFEAVDLIHEQGGLSSIPHPFDALRSSAINDLELIEQLKNKIDFIEINGRCIPKYNRLAREFAEKNKITLVAGSDAHTLGEIGRFYTVAEGGLEDKKTNIVASESLVYPLWIRAKTKVMKVLGV
ncbi:MAG: hypothetical protein MSIBF_03215 [Candidatus Altiarchaeales archaeon IMC4]|nr:MAG: hypothetical protein MSIBF_03215 [Candidatus Altiarchaeales archaeon IMC4]